MRRTILVVALVTLACQQKPDAPASSGSASGGGQSTPPASSSSTSSPAGMASSSPASTGSEAVNVKNTGGTIDIDYADGGQRHKLRGALKDSGKRKYALDAGAEVLEVKPGDGSFKVRKPDGSLLWKVKMEPNKIKVSDNEQNNNPVEIRNGSKGVLDIDKIPMMQRAVIYAELVDRKQ